MAEMFKLAMPVDFKVSRSGKSVVGIGPSNRQIQAGVLPWHARLPGTVSVIKVSMQLVGPGPFLRGLRAPVYRILSENADAGSLHVDSETVASLGRRPALLVKARYSKAGKPLQVHAYLSYLAGQPVYLFFIAEAGDLMDWCEKVADGVQNASLTSGGFFRRSTRARNG